MMESTAVMSGSQTVEVGGVSILFGLPSELVKVLQIKKLDLPMIWVCPSKFVSHGALMAEPEFPFYYYLFILGGTAKILKGEKIKIIGTRDQLARIRDILQTSLSNPSKEILRGWKIEEDLIEAQMKITEHFNRCPDGSLLTVDRAVEFIPIEDGVEIGNLSILAVGVNMFKVISPEGEINIDINIHQRPNPPLPNEIDPDFSLNRPKFGLISLSKCTSGFDKAGYTTAFMPVINSRFLMVDGCAWTSEAQQAVGVNSYEVDAYILSHVHGDHCSIYDKLVNGQRFKLITTYEIYRSFAYKASKVLGWSEESVMRIIDFIEVKPGEVFSWYGAEFHFFRTAHIVFTIGFKLLMEGKELVYFADSVWGDSLDDLCRLGVIFEKTRRTVQDAVKGVNKEIPDVLIMDAGIPPLHPSIEMISKTWKNERKANTFVTHRSVLPEGEKHLRLLYPGTQVELIPAPVADIGDISAVLYSPFASMLDPLWKNALISCKIRPIKKGEIVVEKGGQNDKFYIAVAGAYSVRDGDNSVIAILGTGDFFGEISLIRDVCCTATVKAETNGRLLEVAKDLFLEMVGKGGLRQWLENIHQFRSVFIQCGIAKDLGARVINEISQNVKVRKYRKGERIIAQGQYGKDVLFIASGKVSVEVDANGNGPKKIADIFKYQFFGEMSVFGSGVRNASVYATEDTEVLLIEEADFEKLKNKYPIVLSAFGTIIQERTGRSAL